MKTLAQQSQSSLLLWVQLLCEKTKTDQMDGERLPGTEQLRTKGGKKQECSRVSGRGEKSQGVLLHGGIVADAWKVSVSELAHAECYEVI